MIHIEHLSKSYIKSNNNAFSLGKKHLVLNDISFALDAGKTLIVSGTKNSGKTTLMKILATMISPDSGSVNVLGFDVNKDTKAIRAQVCFLSNTQPYFNHLNTKEQLSYFATLKGLNSKEIRDRVTDVLKKWDLNPKQSVSKLTAEEKMRLSLAQTVLVRPKLILLDEPALGFDVFTAKPIFDMIEEARKEGVGIIYASSNLNNTELFGDEIIFLYNGKMVYQSDMSAYIQRYENASEGFVKIISEANKIAV
jgi:ABC-type multidrug transport system ATPase subunit